MPSAFSTHNTNLLAQYPQAWERAGKVKLLVLDVDGVLTNGQVWIGADGKESLKAFDIQDGLGIKLLEQCGIPTESSPAEIPKWFWHAVKSLELNMSTWALKTKLLH